QLFEAMAIVKSLGRQFYIELVPGDAQIFKVAAGNVEAVLADFVAFFRSIDSHAGHDFVSLDHIGDVEVFNHRVGKRSMPILTWIKAAADFDICRVKRDDAVEPEILNPLRTATSAYAQHGRRLRRNGVPRRTNQLSGQTVSACMVNVVGVI